jgi:hypothetical protein
MILLDIEPQYTLLIYLSTLHKLIYDIAPDNIQDFEFLKSVLQIRNLEQQLPNNVGANPTLDSGSLPYIVACIEHI